jgi:hypothetical protein
MAEEGAVMRLPGFSAEQSLYGRRGPHRLTWAAGVGPDMVTPAIPACANCDEILDRCAENGGRPRAVCRACAAGNCYEGTEDPPPSGPGAPWEWFERLGGLRW